jgi:protein-disulfide isomerase
MITVDPHKSEKEITVTVRRSTMVWLLFVVVAFGTGLGLGYMAWGSQNANLVGAPESLAPEPTSLPQRISVPTDGFPAIGPANAPVTIVEFSDFECPYCKAWFDQTWPQLQAAYSGKIRLVYRDFPLYGAHPDAEAAAEAASCAGEQGQYWQYHDKLFGGNSLNNDTYLAYANDLKLDMTKFQDCMTNHRFQKSVQANYQFGTTLGISGTPTFFVNGIPMVGAQPFSVFKQIIDRELASTK